MRYSEIMEICDANRIKYDKGIRKLDECNFPNDSCYSLAQEIAATVDKALHVGFQRGFHHVSDVIGELTEIAAALSSGRAVKNLPIHNTVVKKFKKQIEFMHEDAMREESVMKNTVKQYIDNSLDAIKYLKKKNERTGLDLKPLNESEKLLKEMDTVLKTVFDEKSEEAVEQVTKICNAVQTWRNHASTGMITDDVVKYLQVAASETRQWSKIYSKKKEAKTPAPVYQDDLLSSYAAYEKHLGTYDMFHKLLDGKRQDIKAQKDLLASRQAKIDESRGKIDALNAELDDFDHEMDVLDRDLDNGDISENAYWSKMEKIKNEIEERESLIEREESRLKALSIKRNSTMDVIAELVDQFDITVENAEMYKMDELVFVEISKVMDFTAMTRVLQGVATPEEIQKVRDTRLNMDLITNFVNNAMEKVKNQFNSDINDLVKNEQREQEAARNRRAEGARDKMDELKAWRRNRLGNKEENDDDMKTENRETNRREERLSGPEDIF